MAARAEMRLTMAMPANSPPCPYAMLAPRNAALVPVALEPEGVPDPATVGLVDPPAAPVGPVAPAPADVGLFDVPADPVGVGLAETGITALLPMDEALEENPGSGAVPFAPGVNKSSAMPFEMEAVVTQLDELGMVKGAVGVTVSPTV